MSEVQSVADVEKYLDKIGELQREIDAAEQKRDESIGYFQQRIDDARQIFETDTEQARMEINDLSVELKRYFDADPPTRKKSMAFAGGTFGYTKQPTRFVINGSEVDSNNTDLLDFIKNGHNEFVKTKESVDWKNLKAALVVDGDDCYLDGELVTNMRAHVQPDKFFVKPRVSP